MESGYRLRQSNVPSMFNLSLFKGHPMKSYLDPQDEENCMMMVDSISSIKCVIGAY